MLVKNPNRREEEEEEEEEEVTRDITVEARAPHRAVPMLAILVDANRQLDHSAALRVSARRRVARGAGGSVCVNVPGVQWACVVIVAIQWRRKDGVPNSGQASDTGRRLRGRRFRRRTGDRQAAEIVGARRVRSPSIVGFNRTEGTGGTVCVNVLEIPRARVVVKACLRRGRRRWRNGRH